MNLDENGVEHAISEMRFSYHFGLVHLLRCLVKLKDFMGYLPSDSEYTINKQTVFEVIIILV